MKLVKIERHGATAEGVLVGEEIRIIGAWRPDIADRSPFTLGQKSLGELQGLLSAADRALGRLDGSVLTLPNPDLFVFMYVRKEAVLSSQIEGTQSSRQNLRAAEAKLFEPSLP